jgi:hypothetical protein
MLGVNLLVRLGRTLFSGPLTDSGVLPASYYRHLALAAMEEENYPEALGYLKWAEDRLLIQVLILRLRLLAADYDRQRRSLEELLASPSPNGSREKCRALLAEEERALELLGKYEKAAQALL